MQLPSWQIEKRPQQTRGGQINQITKLRMPDGAEVAIVDWSWRPLYSTAFIADGATDREVRLFTYARGDTVKTTTNLASAARPSATRLHTNVAEGSEMDATEEMIVYAIQAEVQQWLADANIDGSTETAVNPDNARSNGIPVAGLLGELNSLFILELEVSQKPYFQAGFAWFSAGFGPHLAMSQAGGTDDLTTRGNHGFPTREAVDQAPVPVHLGGTEKYAVKLLNPDGRTVDFRDDAGTVDDDAVAFVRVYLTGLHKRPTG